MNLQQKQLSLELELLLLYLKLPAEAKIQESIRSQKEGWLLLQEHISGLDPAVAVNKFNALLKQGGYDHEVQWLTAAHAKNYIMNDPIVYRLVALAIQFLCCPLKVEINTAQITAHKEAILELTKKKTFGVQEGIEVMERCRNMTQEIADIVAACEAQSVGKHTTKTQSLPL